MVPEWSTREGVWTAGFLRGCQPGSIPDGWEIESGAFASDDAQRFRLFHLSGVCAFSRTEEFFPPVYCRWEREGNGLSVSCSVMEIWPNKSRALLSGPDGAAAKCRIFTIALFALGLANFIKSAHGWLLNVGLSQTWVDWLVANQGWRLLMLLGAVPAVLTFFIRLAVPESEKWLHAQKQGSTSNWATRAFVSRRWRAEHC